MKTDKQNRRQFLRTSAAASITALGFVKELQAEAGEKALNLADTKNQL